MVGMEGIEEYLTTPTTMEKVLAEHTFKGVPFGGINDDWQRLLAKMQPGDELWNFEPPNKNVISLWGVAPQWQSYFYRYHSSRLEI